MKRLNYIILLCAFGFAACKKNIDLYPTSNLNTGTYYSNLEEVKAADRERQNLLEQDGMVVLRCTNDKIINKQEEVIAYIEGFLNQRNEFKGK